MKKKNKQPVTVKGIRKYVRDGYIVVGDVSCAGCVTYSHSDRTEEKQGMRIDAEWKTHKLIRNAQEQEAHTTKVSELRRMVRRLGSHNDSFTLVPGEAAADLEMVLRTIEQECGTYNAAAKCTRIQPNFIVYAVEGNDARLAKGIYDRLVEFTERLVEGIKTGDIKEIRTALSYINGLRGALPEQAAEPVNALVADMRVRARAAVKAVKDAAGSTAETKGTASLVKTFMKGTAVNAVRASLVEVRDTINNELANGPILPVVDARQIEVSPDGKAEADERDAKRGGK